AILRNVVRIITVKPRSLEPFVADIGRVQQGGGSYNPDSLLKKSQAELFEEKMPIMMENDGHHNKAARPLSFLQRAGERAHDSRPGIQYRYEPAIAASIALGKRVWKSKSPTHVGRTEIRAIWVDIARTCSTQARPCSL